MVWGVVLVCSETHLSMKFRNKVSTRQDMFRSLYTLSLLWSCGNMHKVFFGRQMYMV